VARPLREQFLLTTLVLLLPVVGVMIWAANTILTQQLDQLGDEAGRLAKAVAAHIDETNGSVAADYQRYLAMIERETVAVVVIDDASGSRLLGEPSGSLETRGIEVRSDQAEVSRLGWLVTVGLPTIVAWDRAEQIVMRIIAITGLATLMLLVIDAVFVRRWLQSARTLEHHALRIGSGDYTMPPAERMASRELEQMRDTFTVMASRLKEAYDDIARQVEEERRMRREVESLQQQVIRQERLAAIGVLLSGIAHELNNPLQAISGFAQLLQRDEQVSDEVKADLELIQKESARASAIIRNLSRFSRQKGLVPSRVYLRDVVASVVELRQRRLQEQGIELRVEDQAVEPVKAALTELQQVVLNFVINAEHALSTAGVPDPRILIRTRDIAEGVRLEVEDNGPGVPPEDESKLFQPFFTTKPVGEGTGLGLSVSYGIITAMGGTIGYRRGKQGGAEFSFELPANLPDAGSSGT